MKRLHFITMIFCLGLSVNAQPVKPFPKGVFMFGSYPVDWIQMRYELNLNWVQGDVGDSGIVNPYVADNYGGLNVMALRRRTINIPSRGQHMEYEAELLPSTKYNYFSNKESGSDYTNFRLCRVGVHNPGNMVSQPVPNNEFNYGERYYTASFIIKTGKCDDETLPAVKITIRCENHNVVKKDTILNVGDILGNWQTVEVPFDMGEDQNQKSLPTGVMLAAQPKTIAKTECKEIDIQVYWYGNVDFYLDKVIIEDELGKRLHRGDFDNNIRNEARLFTSYPLIQRFYLYDEPRRSSFPSFKKVNDLTLDGIDSVARSRGFGITAFDQTNRLEQFLLEADPHELLIDGYPIMSYIPSPRVLSSDTCTLLGISQWQGTANYESNLQSAVQERLIQWVLKPGAEKAYGFSNPREFWYVPQLHGEYIVEAGKFRWPSNDSLYPNEATRRIPTGNEVKLMVNLALAYGAKGIIAYPFGTDTISNLRRWHAYLPGLVSLTPIGGLYQDHSSNWTTVPREGGTISLWTGYKEKWDALASVYNFIEQNNDIFMKAEWRGTKSWQPIDTINQTAGGWQNLITNVATSDTNGIPDQIVYIETGDLEVDGIHYIYVVNRRSLDSEGRFVKLTFGNNQKVRSLATNKVWLVSSGGTITEYIQPANGLLLKVEPLNLNTTVNIGTTDSIWIEPGNTFQFGDSASLYIQGKLYAIGSLNQPIILTSQSSSGWKGVIIEGMSSSPTHLGYCSIYNCTSIAIQVKQSSPQLYYLTIEGESRTLTGVHYSNNSGGVLTYSTIRNCGLGQGIYISGNSSPEISNNIIIGNRYNGILLLTNNTTVQISENVIANNGVINGVKTYDGIHCRSSNNVYLNGSNISVSYGGLVAHRSYVYGGTPNGYYGCNNITTNVIGIISMSDGLLIIGDGNVGTSNNIYANEDFDAQAEVVSTIIANNNYWGDVTTPNVNCDDESEIIIDTWSTSYLTCDPYLANFTSSQSSSTLSFEQKKLLEANSAYSKKQYVLAMSLYKDLISKSKNNNIIRRALSGLFYVLTATNDKQVLEYFISDKANKDELAVYIKELLLHYYITVENFQSAMELANLLIKEYPNSDTEMNALLLLATLKDFRNEYVLISDDAYNKLCTKYETKINKSILEAIKQTTEVESPVIQNSISGSDVISNYPNPFNPSTIIRFNVNRASWVVLKVYDLLGREIVVLQNGWLEAGAHQAVFDATRLSSGIYFYSIEIAGKRTVKKMLLTK